MENQPWPQFQTGIRERSIVIFLESPQTFTWGENQNTFFQFLSKILYYLLTTSHRQGSLEKMKALFGLVAVLVICQFCNRDFTSIGRHQWQCKSKLNQGEGVMVNSSCSAEAPCSSETPVQLRPLVHLRPLTLCSAGTPCSSETPDSMFSWNPLFI